MTITMYFMTFGFQVKIVDVMKSFGFTLDNITDEWREQYAEENGDNGTDEEVLEFWFEREFFGNGPDDTIHQFEINDVQFVVRQYTHDNKESEKFLVVGVDIGTIDNFNGTVTSTGRNAKKDIEILASEPLWIGLIQIAGDNCTSYSKIKYGVQDPQYEGFSIAPCVWQTTDDCSCCS